MATLQLSQAATLENPTYQAYQILHLVFFEKPHIGAYVVAAWLLGIILNLLLLPGYFDVALRDFGLLLGALALARLSYTFAR